MPISCGEVPRAAFSFSSSAAAFFSLNSFLATLYAIIFPFARRSLFRFGANPRSRAISRVDVFTVWIRRENLSQRHSRRRKSHRPAFLWRAAHAFFSSAARDSRHHHHRRPPPGI